MAAVGQRSVHLFHWLYLAIITYYRSRLGNNNIPYSTIGPQHSTHIYRMPFVTDFNFSLSATCIKMPFNYTTMIDNGILNNRCRPYIYIIAYDAVLNRRER